MSVVPSIMKYIRQIAVLTVLALLFGAASVQAQTPSANWAFETKPLFVGELHDWYTAGGATPHVGGCHGGNFPGWERWMCRGGDAGLWFMTQNFEDYQGQTWQHRVAHIGYRVNGLGEVFPQNIELSLKMEAPTVTVDGLQTFRYATFYDNANRTDMNAVGRVDNTTNSLIGITADRTVRQWSNRLRHRASTNVFLDRF